MAPHSSALAWRIPWTEEPGRLQSMGSRRVGHDWVTSLSLLTFHALEKEKATHSSVLAWRIPRTGEPGEVLSMGLHRVGHDWSGLEAAAAAWRYSLMFSSRSFTVSHLGLWTMSNLCVLCKVHLDFWLASCLVLTPVSGYELAYIFV